MKKDEKKLNKTVEIKGAEKPKQPDYKDVRVFVAVPSTSMVHADFAMALATLGNHNTSVNLRMALNNYKSCDLSHARNVQVMEAQQKQATHLLFIDSDMGFQPWACQRLVDVMRKNKESIVGVTVPKRAYPYTQVAKDVDGKPFKLEMQDNRNLVEASTMGTGMVLIDMKVFKKIEFPYFQAYYAKGKNGKPDPLGRVGEDCAFFEKARAAGFKPMIDVPLSKDTCHIGESKFEYTSEDFFADAIALRQQKAQEMFDIAQKEQQEALKKEQMKENDGKE
jgi:hypothetical protein